MSANFSQWVAWQSTRPRPAQGLCTLCKREVGWFESDEVRLGTRVTRTIEVIVRKGHSIIIGRETFWIPDQVEKVKRSIPVHITGRVCGRLCYHLAFAAPSHRLPFIEVGGLVEAMPSLRPGSVQQEPA